MPPFFIYSPILVPLNITLSLASLLILQVLQDTCIRTDCHIVVFPTSERRKTGRQVETMQITCDSTRGLRNFFCLKIITGIERDRPIIGDLHISIRIDIMCVGIRISH